MKSSAGRRYKDQMMIPTIHRIIIPNCSNNDGFHALPRRSWRIKRINDKFLQISRESYLNMPKRRKSRNVDMGNLPFSFKRNEEMLFAHSQPLESNLHHADFTQNSSLFLIC